MTNPTLFLARAALRALATLSFCGAAILIAAPHAAAAEPVLAHELCDPRSPAEDMRQAAHCTTLEAKVIFNRVEEYAEVDRVWMKLEGPCEIERRDGSKVTYKGDDSEDRYEFKGKGVLPVDVRWSFPSGCTLKGHTRALGEFPYPDTIGYFNIDGSIMTGDAVAVFLDVAHSSVKRQ